MARIVLVELTERIPTPMVVGGSGDPSLRECRGTVGSSADLG